MGSKKESETELNEEIVSKIKKEMLVQAEDLIESSATEIAKAYMKSFDLAVSFASKMKGNGQFVTVKSKISFATGNFSESMENEVALVQPDMFKEEEA